MIITQLRNEQKDDLPARPHPSAAHQYDHRLVRCEFGILHAYDINKSGSMNERIDGYDQRVNFFLLRVRKSTNLKASLYTYTYTYPYQPLAAKSPEERTWITRNRPHR